jgi:putative intracellular protease/amidase
MKILIVLTSHSQLGQTQLGNTEGKTGFWIEELATPYYIFQEEGATITLASPKGGQPPIDPKSDAPENQTEATIRYKADSDLLDLMANTIKLENVSSDDFDAVFYPGGHGPLWDLTIDENSIRLIEEFWDAKKPVAAVCHAPSVLLNVKDEDGNFLIKGKKVTGFSNTEEVAVKLDKIVPFMLEDELKKKGGIYSKKDDWTSYVVKDGLLITGQNPQSSEAVAKELLAVLQK